MNWFGAAAPQQMGAEISRLRSPYGSPDYVVTFGAAPSAGDNHTVVPLVRGDLEETAYPLYFGYTVAAAGSFAAASGDFCQWSGVNGGGYGSVAGWATGGGFDGGRKFIASPSEARPPLVKRLLPFVHIAAPDGLIGQADAPPGGAAWRADWWQPGLLVAERRVIGLERPFDPSQHHIFVGLYDNQTGERLPLAGTNADSWEIPVDRICSYQRHGTRHQRILRSGATTQRKKLIFAPLRPLRDYLFARFCAGSGTIRRPVHPPKTFCYLALMVLWLGLPGDGGGNKRAAAYTRC
ncbi:MAG: hypothetical protein H6668_07200 [Ardenticatenaceae bacterium]|nr:hypothetical protein [Ardenticatenaceae bacterium]